MSSKLPPLGDLEHELLTILWAGEEMTAAAVRNKVRRKLQDATIRTVLRRLEEKGYVTHTVDAGTFHLAPDAHDAAKFVAFWLERDRGWVEVDTGGTVEWCPGLTTTEP